MQRTPKEVKLVFKQILVHKCSKQHYLHLPKDGNNTKILSNVNG